MKRQKKRCLSFLILCFLILSAAISVFAFGEENGVQPKIYVEAGEPDEDGFVYVSVSMENTSFLAYELALRYNPEAVIPADAHGESVFEFSEFSGKKKIDGLSSIGEKLDAEKGYFVFTQFCSIGATGEYVQNGMIHIPEKTELYRFRFKKISDEDMGFAVASIYDGGVYDEFFPDGAFVAVTGEERVSADVLISYSGTEKKTETAKYFYSELYPENFTKEQRLQNTVYLVNGDYASAVSGALCVIDAENHAVTPFNENGTQYLPLRFVAESLGFTVDWEDETHTVILKNKNGVEKKLCIPEMQNRGEEVSLVNSRTMVGEELLCRLTGARVFSYEDGFVVYDSIVEWTPDRLAEQEALEAMKYVMLPFFRMFIG